MTFKKNNLKIRNISLFITLVLFITIIPCSNVTAINNSKTKTYIVVINSQKSYKKIVEKIGNDAISENETLEENNVISADLTESEAQLLGEENGVLFVEEDFYMEANELDESDWEENPPLSREEVTTLKMAYREEKEELLDREYVEPEDYEWNMKAVDANEVVTDSPIKTKVAVLDSGIDMVTGIELADSINLVPEEENISPLFLDISGHGTGVASIIAGTAQNKVQGVNPNVALYSVKVLDAMNRAPVSRIIEGIYWCIDNEMQIINMSFGTSKYSEALQNAVEEAYEAGILMIGAAGNNADDVEYPAAFPEVMAVAATGTDSQITDFSNTGDELEIAAPGEKIKVIGFFGGNTITEGTSISAPHVTGAASLLWQRDPSKSNEFIRQLLSYSAKDIANSDDCGLLDVAYALEIYDEFAENFDGTMVGEEHLPRNTGESETFEYIDDDENYVEGRWGAGSHQGALEYGFTENDESITSDRFKIMKIGAIYQDGIAAFGNAHLPGWHGTAGTNYVANYELLTRIALKSGNTSTFTDAKWQSIPGMSSQSRYKAMRDVFVMSNGVPSKVGTAELGYKTWKQIFKYVDQVYGTTVGANYGNDSTTDAKSRKRFIWGMSIHYVADIFAHDTYQKSTGKQIVHSSSYTNSKTQIDKADTATVVKRRYDVAKATVDWTVVCFLTGLYGDWMELDWGLYNAKEYSNNDENFRKSKLLTYVKSNSENTLTTSEKNRFTAASIND